MKRHQLFTVCACFFLSLHTAFSQNNSLQFDGLNDYVNLNAIAGDMSTTKDFTVEFWMRATIANQTSRRVGLFAVNTAIPGDNEFIIAMGGAGTIQTGQLVIFDQYTTGSPFEIVTTEVIGDGNCHHIAYTRTGDTGRAYIDGLLVGTHHAGYAFLSSHRYSLGQEWDINIPSDFYNGNMDEIRIWNIARTQAQIQNTMNISLSGTETGLLSYYNCNQGVANSVNTGINSLTDLTSNANAGILTNFALSGSASNWVRARCSQTIRNNNSLQFDGANDYVNLDAIAGDLSTTNDFTVEFWMRATIANQTSRRVGLFAVNTAIPGDNEFIIAMGGAGTIQTGQLVIFDQYTTGSPFEIVTTQVIGDGDCHHIAYTRTGNTGIAYIDGVPVGTHNAGYAFLPSHRYSLGQEWDIDIPSDFYNGNMDEIRIWNFARTQTQIQNSMNTTLTGTEAGLLSYYNCNQGLSGGNNTGIDVLVDLTANMNHGNLTNFALTGTNSNWVIESCQNPALKTQTADQTEFQAKAILYPNPANNLVHINNLNREAKIQIINSVGQRVMTVIADDRGSVSLNTNQLENGVYFVFEQRKGDMQLIDKLIIQK